MSAYRPLSAIDEIIIHCADVPNGRETTAADIDRWHGERQPPFHRDPRALTGEGPWAGRGPAAAPLQVATGDRPCDLSSCQPRG